MVDVRMADMTDPLSDEIPTPAWVMYGFEKPDGTVQVWASGDVTKANAPWLSNEEADLAFLGVSDPKIRLNVTMKRMTMTRGRSFREAFEHLFRRWSPDPDRTQIDARPQVEGERT